MNPRWLLRMAQWARHPPSTRRVMIGVTVGAICLALFSAERFGLLPDWMALPTSIRR